MRLPEALRSQGGDYQKLLFHREENYLKFCRQGDHGEGLPHGQALLPVDEQRVRLDLQVVLQAGLSLQQPLEIIVVLLLLFLYRAFRMNYTSYYCFRRIP